MRISEIDLYHLSGWMNAVFEQVEKQCEEELERESETYRKIIKEEHTLLDQFPFLATLADRGEIAESMELTVEEVRALSRYMALEDDRRAIESVKYYLLGGRGAVEVMELLGIL